MKYDDDALVRELTTLRDEEDWAPPSGDAAVEARVLRAYDARSPSGRPRWLRLAAVALALVVGGGALAAGGFAAWHAWIHSDEDGDFLILEEDSGPALVLTVDDAAHGEAMIGALENGGMVLTLDGPGGTVGDIQPGDDVMVVLPDGSKGLVKPVFENGKLVFKAIETE